MAPGKTEDTAAAGKKNVEDTGGMSATSGPLDDQMAHGYHDEEALDREVREEAHASKSDIGEGGEVKV